MARPSRGRNHNEPSLDWLLAPEAANSPMETRWAESHAEGSRWGQMVGQQPFAFPPLPVLRLSQPEELAKLKAPNDVPVQVLEGMRSREGYKRYVNYPSRLFHLRPQSNLRIPKDLDWEKAFLWQRVSSSLCKAAWIQEFPCPALELPLLSFPEAILRRGMTMRVREGNASEALDFAAAVLRTTGRGASEPAAPWDVPWRDVKKLAVDIISHFERRGRREAIAMAARVREHQRVMDDYRYFFRFRDANRKPTGMGFRGTRDTLLLDDDFLTDFLNRASQGGDRSQRRRSDVKLVSFLNSRDATKVTIVAVSTLAFRGHRARLYLCYALARTFPNLERLLLTSIGTVGRETARVWGITPQQPRFGELQQMAEDEMRRNGGSSFADRPDEDPGARFDAANMSPRLVRATGAYPDGKGRALAGEYSRTPLVAYGLKAGLLHDPAGRQPGAAGEEEEGAQDPPAPFVKTVQDMLTAAFRVIVRRREAAARAARAEALAKLEGRPTRLPRPVLRGPVGRLYRRSEVTPEDEDEWKREYKAKKRRRHAAWITEDLGSETDPDSEDSVPAEEVGPFDREYALVEPWVLIYDRDAFDANVLSGWTGFGPGVDLSHFGQS